MSQYQPAPGSPLADVASELVRDGDVVRLNPGGYKAYSQLIRKVCWALGEWCRAGGSSPAVRSVGPLVDRLARSVELLVYRYLHSRQHDLTLDLRNGGFPSVIAFMELVADLQQAPQAIAEGENRAMLREQIIHELSKGNDPVELVWALARRVYTRRITQKPLFLPFTLGDLVEGARLPNGRRAGEITWGYYDVVHSLPALFHMEFEWSGKQNLSDDKTQLGLLYEVLRGESSRSRSVVQLAKMIDLTLMQLHPKAVRRIQLGPLRSARFSCEDHPMVEALRCHGQEGDFALEIQVEGALSEGEYEPRPTGIVQSFFGGGQILQIFSPNPTDSQARQAGASFVTPMLLLPHRLVQELASGSVALRGYVSSNLITYDQGKVYAS